MLFKYKFLKTYGLISFLSILIGSLYYTLNSFYHKNVIKKKIIHGRSQILNRKSSTVKIFIGFGSQTGTAESFSYKIKDEIENKWIDSIAVDVIELNNVSFSQLFQPLCLWVFCVATYGDGEPTTNAYDFFTLLSNFINHESFIRDFVFYYAIIGFGSREYIQFNSAARTLNKYLKKVGGIPICKMGLADDLANKEQYQIDWLKLTLLPAVENYFKSNLIKSTRRPDLRIGSVYNAILDWLINKKNVVFSLNCQKSLMHNLMNKLTRKTQVAPRSSNFLDFIAKSKIVYAIYTDNLFHLNQTKRNSKHVEWETSDLPFFRDVLLVHSQNFNLQDYINKEWSYYCGDTIEVITPYSNDIVEWFFNRLIAKNVANDGNAIHSMDLHSVIPLNSIFETVPSFLTSHMCSIDTIFRYFLELSSCPKISTLKKLSSFITNSEEYFRLHKILLTPKNYADIIQNSMLNLKECIILFFSSAIFGDSKTRFLKTLKCLPLRQIKQYTLASSFNYNKNKLGLTISRRYNSCLPSLQEVVSKIKSVDSSYYIDLPSEYIMPRTFNGSTSSFFCDLQDGMKRVLYPFLINVQRLNLLNQNIVCNNSLILIVLGSGISIARSIWQEIASHLKESTFSVNSCRENASQRVRAIFYGCRYQNDNSIYNKEIKEFMRTNSGVISHFYPCYTRNVKKKKLVQDELKNKKKFLKHYITAEEGYIIICGTYDIGIAIKQCLREIFDEVVYSALLKDRRLIQETWD